MKRVALCVGINDYGVDHSLQGASPDAELVCKTLKSKYDSVELLTDARATVRTVKEVLRSLVSTLSWGDILVFFFSGHGCDVDGVQTLAIPDRDEGGNCDGMAFLSLSEVEEITNKPGVQRVFVLDCCRVCDKSLFWLFKRVVDELIGAGKASAEDPSCIKPILLASCARGQSSLDDTRARQGHFTRAFVRALRSREVRSFNKFRQKLDEYMGDFVLPIVQTPFIEGGIGADIQMLPSWRKQNTRRRGTLPLTNVQGRGLNSASDPVFTPADYERASNVMRIKIVRSTTKVSLAMCKKAVAAAGASFARAIEYVRDNCEGVCGSASGAALPCGTVALAKDPKGGRMAGVCLRCETVLGSRAPEFVDCCDSLARRALSDSVPADEADRQCSLTSQILGERVEVAEEVRFVRTNCGCLGSYVHLRKVLAMVEVGCDKASSAKKKLVSETAHAIAVHVAAKSPRYVEPSEIPQEEIDAQVDSELAQLKKKFGKLPPKSALECIKRGIACKYAAEVCLLWQPCQHDETMTIQDYLQKVGKSLGDTVSVFRFRRLSVAD